MILRSLWRFGKVLVRTARVVRRQRDRAAELAALEPNAFVDACLDALNHSGGAWHGSARAPATDDRALARIARLPAPLAAFYRACDGFASDSPAFPVPIVALAGLQLGADLAPPLSAQMRQAWSQAGNATASADRLMVLPPDDLGALLVEAEEFTLPVSALDAMAVLCPPADGRFVVIALTGLAERLPVGTVLDVEAGSATRYADFRHWLATQASVFDVVAA